VLKLLKILVIFYILPINAAIIELGLESIPEYRHTEYDAEYNIINESYVVVDSQKFSIDLDIDLSSSSDANESVFSGIEYTQYNSEREFSNYSFGLSSPFLDAFNPFITGDVMDSFNPLLLDWSYLNYNVYYNDTSDLDYIGGDASIRFGKTYKYEGIDPVTGNRVYDDLWLSGRLFLQNINSLEEYRNFKEYELSEVIDLADGAFVRWNTSFSKEVSVDCDFPCDSFVEKSYYYGASYGNSSIASVPEASGFLVLFIGLLFLNHIRRQKVG